MLYVYIANISDWLLIFYGIFQKFLNTFVKKWKINKNNAEEKQKPVQYLNDKVIIKLDPTVVLCFLL